MIEEMVLAYLNTVLDVPAYMEAPEDDSVSYVLVEKTGGSETDHIKSATIVLQSYASKSGTMYEAARLNEAVKKVMNDIIYSRDISRSKLNSDYEYTDTEKKRYRYQAVYDLVY